MKQLIRTITISNGWNTLVVKILCEERGGKFIFKLNLISILTKPVELSHKWVLKIFKYQEPAFYARLFYQSQGGPLEFPPGHTKVGVIRKPVSGAPKLYYSRKSIVLMCSIHFTFNFSFVGVKFASDHFKDEIIPSLR